MPKEKIPGLKVDARSFFKRPVSVFQNTGNFNKQII
jgi:hypothetical protein